MYFKNDTMSITVLVNGYTEMPEVFISKKTGRNALSCVASFDIKEPFCSGVIFDEFFIQLSHALISFLYLLHAEEQIIPMKYIFVFTNVQKGNI